MAYLCREVFGIILMLGRAYPASRQPKARKPRPNTGIKPTKLHTDFAAYATKRADFLETNFSHLRIGI